MKQVIDGKVYDTDTATKICALPVRNAQYGDARWHETCLYRTRGGRFFLAGKGNAFSMWGQPVGNMRAPGEGLRAVDQQETRQCMELAGCSPEQFTQAGLPVEEA